MNARRFLAGIGLATAMFLTACGGGGDAAEPAASSAGGGTTTLDVAADSSGALAFEQTSLTAPADTAFSVNFSNPAPLDHNWVLVQPGQEDAVANAGAANNGTVPEGTAGVIAAGAVLGPNGQETIQVPAQPAGSYPYICTVPGHYASGMRGTLTVQ